MYCAVFFCISYQHLKLCTISWKAYHEMTEKHPEAMQNANTYCDLKFAQMSLHSLLACVFILSTYNNLLLKAKKSKNQIKGIISP